MDKTLKNRNGFAMAVVMALLPILLGAMFFAFSTISFVQADLKLKHVCRSEGIKGQEEVAPLLKELLGLNPKALKLKAREIQLKIQIAAAELAENHYQAIKLGQELVKVQEERRVLDEKQKQLIKQANISLRNSYQSAQRKLDYENKYLQSLDSLLKSSLQVKSSRIPELAVRPDYTDTAPTYSTTPQFDEEQSLVQQWQYSLAVVKPLQPFLQGDFKFQKSCAVTLKKESNQWVAKIRKDKSWSKWL